MNIQIRRLHISSAILLISAATVVGCGNGGAAGESGASDFVQSKINTSWIKGPDGWTTRLQARNLLGQVMRDEPPVLFKQYRELKFLIQPETVTEAQRLNGADYRAGVEFKNSPVRYYRKVQTFDGPKGWSPWEDGNPAFGVAVERRNGKWLISDHELFEGLKPDSATVPAGK